MRFFLDGIQDCRRNLVLAVTLQLFTQIWWSLHRNLGFWGHGTHWDDKEQHWTIMLHNKLNLAPNMVTNTSIKRTIYSDLATCWACLHFISTRNRSKFYWIYMLRVYKTRCPRKASFFKMAAKVINKTLKCQYIFNNLIKFVIFVNLDVFVCINEWMYMSIIVCQCMYSCIYVNGYGCLCSLVVYVCMLIEQMYVCVRVGKCMCVYVYDTM